MANEDYLQNGASILFNGEATATVALSIENVTSGNGQVSAQRDLGAAPRPYLYHWSCEVQFQATPTQGKGIEIWLATAPDSDNTQIDGDVGSTDAALGDADMRRNLTFVGSVISENPTAGEKCVNSGLINITARYISVVIYNDSGATINATDSNFRFDLQPKYSQGQ